MKKIISIALAVIMAVMTFAFAGCGAKETSKTDIEYIKEKGTLIVGITDYKPMDYKDENGKWIGFDAELAEAFAAKLGVKAEFIEVDWDNKFTELKSKSIDCVWNGMTITDEATKNSSVSDPYVKNSQVVVIDSAKASQYKTIESLKGLNFAVEKGSAGATAATDNGFTATEVDTQSTALLEVKSGSCDACIIDKTMADATVGAGSSYANLTVAMTLSTEEFGISFRQNSDVTAELNKFITEYKASGDFNKLAEKYNVSVDA